MKKICLLTIGSFFSVIAFSQNAVKSAAGQPKIVRNAAARGTITPATTATAPTTTIVASAGDVGKTKNKAIARTTTTRTTATKRSVSTKLAAPKAEY